jgi:hypothetical protein
MIDQIRFRAAASKQGTPTSEFTSLRLAMQMHGASVSIEHTDLHPSLHQRALQSLEKLETDPSSGNMMSIKAVQAWVLVAVYEFKQTLFSRAWMSVGRASRLAQMLELHRIDAGDFRAGDGPRTLRPASDWAEAEERRRVFWCVFNIDRYSNLGTGWPMSLSTTDVSPTHTDRCSRLELITADPNKPAIPQ